MSKEKDFLSRWSRRKREGAPEEGAPETPETVDAAEPEVEPAPDPEADSLLLQELGLDEPEDVRPGADLAAYLRAAIPAHLKRRALRQLWGSNPVLANLDGLNDYDGDFTGNSVPRGELKTVYRVGKGMIRDLIEADDEDAPASDPEEPEIAALAEKPEEPGKPEEDEAQDRSDAPQDQFEQPAKRRMAFRFDGDEG